MVISIQNQREWRRFCAEVLLQAGLAEDPRFHDNPARVANRPALDREIAAVLGRLPLEQAVDRLAAAGVAYGRLNDVAGLAAHPQLRTAGVETPSGVVDLIAPPARISGAETDYGPVPALGCAGCTYRREFGG